MKAELIFPSNAPHPGFYYHHKHTPDMSVGEYAYEVLNVGNHTETDEYLVIYRPLYESSVYKAGKMWDVRPLAMFMEPVTVNGEIKPRFAPITDVATIKQLEEIRDVLYS